MQNAVVNWKQSIFTNIFDNKQDKSMEKLGKIYISKVVFCIIWIMHESLQII